MMRVYSGTCTTEFFRGYNPETHIYDQTKIPRLESKPLIVDFFAPIYNSEEDIESGCINIARTIANNTAKKYNDQALIMSGKVKKKSLRQLELNQKKGVAPYPAIYYWNCFKSRYDVQSKRHFKYF